MTRRIALFLILACAAAAQRIPSPESLKYPPLKQVTIPEPVEFTLSNGMRVFLLENHELPIIRGLALVRTGNLFDPADKRGLSQIMAEVMRSGGTGAKTGDQLDEDLENVAASVESSMGETSASVSFSGLKETADQVLSVFKDVLTDPEFRQDKIDLSLNQMRGAIARRNDEASEIPRRELLSILYGRDNSYGWTIEYEHLARIKREDLTAFYERYYFPKNIMLGIYGDFSAAEMRTQLESLFSSWTVEKPAVPAFPEVTARPSPGVYFASKPDVTQTFFSIGHLGGTFRDPDYPALEVATSILGEGFKSRLVSQIRTRLGYAYSIGATWAAQYTHPGTFRIGGSTKSETTVEALQAIRAEVEKLRTEQVTQMELDEAKQSVLNSFVFFFDSPAKTLNRVLQYTYFGYPKDFLFQYQKAIEGVTRADVLRVAKEHIHPENLTIVTVGNAEAMPKPLSTLGTVNTIDLTIPEAKPELSSSTDASLARGQALLERARQAMGGTAKVAAVKDWTVSMEMTAQGTSLKQVTKYIAPDHLRLEQNLPFGLLTIYTDGKSGWMAAPQGVQNLPGEVLKQVQGELFRQPPTLLMAKTANAVDENTVEIAGGSESVRLSFDPATGLLARMVYDTTTEIFSDWRDVDGLKLPHKIVVEENGQKVAEATVTSFVVNGGLRAEDLGRRP